RAAVFVPGALVAAVAGTAAVLLAALGQEVVPAGLAGRIGVGRGLADDLGFLVLAGIGSAAVLLVVLALAARPARRRDASVSTRSGRSTPWRWPAVGAGLRAATGGLASAGRRQALAAVTGVAVAAVGMAAVGVIVQSRTALRADLSRVGKFFDVWLYTYADPDAATADRHALLAAESVAGVATIETFRLRAGGVGTAAIVVTPDKGDMGLTMLQGRPVDAADEVVAAPSLLRQLGAGIGDSIELAGTEEPRRFRIVGTAAFPFAAATAAAEQLAITPEGRLSLGISPEGFAIGLDLVDRSVIRGFRAGNDNIDACDTARLEQVLGVDGLAGPASGAVFLCVPRSDQRISNLDELGALPGGVSGLLAVLGTAGLAYLLGASFRRARRDLAVLRVLGFSRGQTAVTVFVQAGTVALVGSLVALPFGIALGRLAWRNVAQGIGIVPTPEVSVLGTLGVAVGAVVVAVLVAAPFVARTLSRPAAAWLRAE
ncbi:MAG TPA: ABC transporter permease, partial [Acidimicrobiales bacterium]